MSDDNQVILPDKILENEPPEKILEVAQAVAIAMVESFSGPLPSPEMLKQYEEVLPGLAERLVVIHEKDREHDREMDSKQLEAAINYASKGQNRGYYLALIGIIAGLVAIVLGLTLGEGNVAIITACSGGLISSVSLVAMVSKLIDGPNSRKQALNKKNQTSIIKKHEQEKIVE